jgi:hypothetical protein
MKLDFKDLPAKLAPILEAVKHYLSFATVIGFIGIYSFLVFRINTLARSDPSEDAVTEKLQTVKQPKIDRSAVEKLEQLEDQNIEVKTLFDNARQNPFAE